MFIRKIGIAAISVFVIIFVSIFFSDKMSSSFGFAEPNIFINTIAKKVNTEPTKWSWIDPNNKKEVTWSAEQAFEDATNYVEGDKLRQLEALKMYQRVLDANPPRLLELHIRLTMGSRMMILYNPDLGETDMYEEALKWYEKLVHDFNDLGNHTDMMTAKVHLGNLYCWNNYGIAEAQKASDLYMEVINIPL